MIVVVDVGNTAIKLAVMKRKNILLLQRSNPTDFKKHLSEICSQYPNVKEVAVCTVGAVPADFHDILSEFFGTVFEVNNDISLPFTNHYQSTSLGADRLALVAGAMQLRTDHGAVLVIDAGTCITYDILDQNNQYLGGAISPGLQLRYKALHNFTARLPLLERAGELKDFVGRNTEDAIHSGVINGIGQEILGVIQQYKNRFQPLEIFITGGDSELLVKQLKNRFFATPFLMLQGICHLYNFNKNL